MTKLADTLISYMSTPITHILCGLLCMTLVSSGQLPLVITLYLSLCTHAALVFISTGDVTSCPNANLVLAVVIAEFAFTCYCVTKSDSIGLLVNQGVTIAVVQTAVHVAYLMTSSGQVTHTIGLGEGRGRQKLTENQQED